MHDSVHSNYLDLNTFRGVGEDPRYRPPQLAGRPRAWPLDRWADAPRDLGYNDFAHRHWKGLRLLKDPATQAAYHDLLWELRPRTIIELGVYSGGSLVWLRDLAALMALDCELVGVDKQLGRCQITPDQMAGITLCEADCNVLASLAPLLATARHPLLLIDDAHCNTFNVMRWAVEHLLEPGDYFIVEDMMAYWERYSPALLADYLASFRDELHMDMLYANSCPQLQGGVFRRSTIEQQGAQLQRDAQAALAGAVRIDEGRMRA